MTATPATVWLGRVLSGLVVVFLLVDAIAKLVPLQPVIDTTRDLGWPSDPATLRWLGATLLASTLLHLLPRTRVFGAVVLTAYLGGAVATHMRIGSPVITHGLFGVYVGVMLWGGLWLRDPRVRALLPFVRDASGREMRRDR